jgi:hypothetical protein
MSLATETAIKPNDGLVATTVLLVYMGVINLLRRYPLLPFLQRFAIDGGLRLSASDKSS